MKENQLFAKKSLGQHFLKDQGIIKKICTDFISPENQIDALMEIGPGPMTLTKMLSQLNLPFFAVEKDERFYELILKELPKVKITREDALEFNWNDFLSRENLNHKSIWLVSNLPYNISVPLLISFTKVVEINFLTLMFQKEVGAKIFNFTNEKNFSNSLGLLMTNYFELKLLAKVPPGAFSPPPKVDSVVLSFKRKPNPLIPLIEFKEYETFLRLLFKFKRKQVIQPFKHIQHILEIFGQSNINKTDRAEALNLEQINSLYFNLKRKK